MIATILGFLGSRLGAGIVAAVVLALTLSLGVQTARLADARGDAAKLADRIDNPVNGYVVKLADCRGDVDRMADAVGRQNDAVTALRAEGDRKVAEAEKAVTEAQKGRASAESRAAKLLKNPPAGIDACARAMSAFETVKESLK